MPIYPEKPTVASAIVTTNDTLFPDEDADLSSDPWHVPETSSPETALAKTLLAVTLTILPSAYEWGDTATIDLHWKTIQRVDTHREDIDWNNRTEKLEAMRGSHEKFRAKHFAPITKSSVVDTPAATEKQAEDIATRPTTVIDSEVAVGKAPVPVREVGSTVP